MKERISIYVASSWRNEYQQDVVEQLRRETRCAVYDFRNPEEGNAGFHWSEVDVDWQQWDVAQFARGLEHPVAEKGYQLDMLALHRAEIVVLLLPSGRSAHLEAGWAAGRGKTVYVLSPEPMEPELMYKMARGVFASVTELVDVINSVALLAGGDHP